ncbi:MAG: hypothetical protein AAGB46_09730 [Verrucomicrobiota bacterium]
MTFKLFRRFAGVAALAAAGLTCVQTGTGEENSLSAELSRSSGKTDHAVPAFEYSFSRELKHVAPMAYKSVSAEGLALGLRHRLDALWSGADNLLHYENTASDFPVVAEVKYRLRSSPWSDPERMVEARLLDGTNYQIVVNRSFGAGRTYNVTTGVQHAESYFADEADSRMAQTTIPIEIRTEVGRGMDFLFGGEIRSSRLFGDNGIGESDEFAAKLGFGAELSEDFYAQVSGGARTARLRDFGEESTFEMDASVIWKESADVQYVLTFNRSIRPSLLAEAFVESETIAFSGDYALSDMWASHFGVAQSYAEFDEGFSRDIFSGEIAIRFSPTESVNFSGGYVYRSGSLNRLSEEDAENIVRFSASILY